MTLATVITLSVTAALAFIGYFATYFNNVETARRKDRIERLNRQLSEFYGPLFGLVGISNITWDVFSNKVACRREGTPFWRDEAGPPPTDEEMALWRLWMTAVFMPMTRSMVELVLKKSDLLREESMPLALLLLCAHVSSYEAVFKEWENGDYRNRNSAIDFPRAELVEYVNLSFRRLKGEQQRLLGSVRPRPRRFLSLYPGRYAGDVLREQSAERQAILSQSERDLRELSERTGVEHVQVWKET